MAAPKPKRPVPPVVLGINTKTNYLRKVVQRESNKDHLPEDVALDILCEYADYGQKCEAYFRKFDNWAAQNGKTIIKEAKGKQ